MTSKSKILIYLIVLALIDMIVPVPILALVLIYVILERPGWFKKTVLDIYGENF